MAIAPHIKEGMSGSSFIRKMFEDGIQLKKKFGEDNVYDFSLGNPDLEPPEGVISAIKEEAAAEVKGSHGYMPNPGYPETRAAIAKKISLEQNKQVSGENIVMSVGAAGALNCVFKAILSPGDEVIVPAPFFVEYRSYAANHGGKLIPVPTNEDFSLNITEIKKALSDKTAAVLINSPNNPTGKVYSDDDIIMLSDTLAAHGEACGRKPYLIADEPYRAIIYNDLHVAPVFQYYDDAIVVSSFAKDFSLPGERLGYIAVNPASESAADVIAACGYATRVLGYVNAPAFFQRVIARCWDAKADYSSYVNRRNSLTAILKKAGIPYAEPEGAFYLFCKVPERTVTEGEISAGAFCDHLKKYNILGVPGAGFGKEGWFRLAYCVSEKTIVNSEAAFCKARKEW